MYLPQFILQVSSLTSAVEDLHAQIASMKIFIFVLISLVFAILAVLVYNASPIAAANSPVLEDICAAAPSVGHQHVGELWDRLFEEGLCISRPHCLVFWKKKPASRGGILMGIRSGWDISCSGAVDFWWMIRLSRTCVYSLNQPSRRRPFSLIVNHWDMAGIRELFIKEHKSNNHCINCIHHLLHAFYGVFLHPVPYSSLSIIGHLYLTTTIETNLVQSPANDKLPCIYSNPA